MKSIFFVIYLGSRQQPSIHGDDKTSTKVNIYNILSLVKKSPYDLIYFELNSDPHCLPLFFIEFMFNVNKNVFKIH